jgi:hypothetical protein
MTLYTAITLFWAWPPARFLVPVMPVFGVFFLLLARGFFQTLLRSYAAVGIWIMSGAIVCTNLVQQARLVQLARDTGYPYAAVPVTPPASWAAYTDMFRWIRENTTADVTIASGLDSMIYLYTSRVGVRPFIERSTSEYYQVPGPAFGTVGELITNFRASRVDYLVSLPMPGMRSEEYVFDLVGEALTSRPQCLQERYRSTLDSRFVVYAVNLEQCAWPGE